MKYIDKFLKKLNVDRNTFATFILTLITIYIAVDRIVEMLLMIFTGVSVSYWNPIIYTLALACPVFAFLFSGPSAFAKTKNVKVTLFFTYIIGLYVIALSMFVQWLNMFGWLFLLSVPNYVELVTDFSDLIKPAFTAISLYLPLVTFFPVIKWIVLGVNDSKDMTRSIWDYAGISLSDTKEGHGPYTCEIFLCKDKETNKSIVFSENSRFQPLLICGGSGTGKTSLIFEPMIARDFERIHFFKEISKELGFTALKTNIATLNCPYSNEYINQNFNLNMLTPVTGKETVYKAFVKKMILSDSSDITFKNLGTTYLTPDFETISHMIDVCKNYKINYNLIDPSSSSSIGLNPFVYDDPSKIAVTISSVIKGMYNDAHEELEEAYREDVTIQAIENLSILLKEMYPRLNDGALPNLEDLLKMLTNFDLVEKMCEILKTNEELAEQYSIQLAYFKNNFYKDGKGRKDTENYVYSAITQIDNLLRAPGVKNVLCNRHNNINFDNALKNGEVTFVCTRRGDLGASTHKAFGTFFLLAMQNSVLRRPGTEKTRIPHFLYIDEFSDFISKSTEPIFTMYRKYRVGTVISLQNLTQLETPTSKYDYKSTILSNCANKIFTGNSTPDELAWWSKEFGQRREWTYQNSMDMNKLEYDSKYSNVKWEWKNYFDPSKLGSLKFKLCAYKIKGDGGKLLVGEGMFNFLESKYKEEQDSKFYDFAKFTSNSIEDNTDKKIRFNPKNITFEDDIHEVNPVQTDDTDSTFLFDNEDAITFNFKNKK